MKRYQERQLLVSLCFALCSIVSVCGYDLTKEKICYLVPNTHLDDQWNATFVATDSAYIPNTLHDNFTYFGRYPDYKFNFEGAYRYWLAAKYGGAIPQSGTLFRAHDYDTLKSYITQGRWVPCGSFVTACDVNLPSPEALIRQCLYGNEFFKDEYGIACNDAFLLDCFGFGYALPTIEAHCGLKGFSTQKYDMTWGGNNPPFEIGRWTGVDGSGVVACMKPDDYNNCNVPSWAGNVLRSKTTSFPDGPGGQPGICAAYEYVWRGDIGGAPDSNTVKCTETLIQVNSTNDYKVYLTSAGQLFDDLTPAMTAALPAYDGELLLQTHGTGCLTAWAPMKLKNRMNEQRAALAEFACVAANCFTNGSFTYPQSTLHDAWWRMLECQFHDGITGTSIEDVYGKFDLPAEDSSFTDFTGALGLGNTALANSANQVITTSLTAQDGRIPLVLVNSLGSSRTDVVEATVNFGNTAPAGVKVYDPSGAEVPAQINGTSGQNVTIAFVATVPAAGYCVYEAKPVTQPNAADPNLTANASAGTMENAYYKVQVDPNGSITSIIDKKVKTGGQQLLSGPSRYEMRPDQCTSMWPQWEIRYVDCIASPTYTTGAAQISVQENGPARVSLKVVTTSGSSTFTQYIQLAGGEAGKRININNEVNWQNTGGSLLKIGFPLTCANPQATWDLGLGTIQRHTMDTMHYEVPGQQWADLTNPDNSFGVSILTDCKYGWNKESDSKLNLTIIHSPAQAPIDQSTDPLIGIHKFRYSIYSHAGDWTNGTVQQARSLNQPIYAYQTQPKAGSLNMRTISLLSADTDQVDIMAIKKAEKSGSYIVRVRETKGKVLQNAQLTFAKAIVSATEVTGQEDPLTTGSPLQVFGNTLTFSLAKYQPRAFSVTLGGVVNAVPRFGSELRPSNRTVNIFMASAGVRRTIASFSIPEGQPVRSVSIIDVQGRLVRNLMTTGDRPATGLIWDGTNMRSQKVGVGTYLVRCVSGSASSSAKFAVLK